MESVQSWSKEYFLNNQEACLQKLSLLSLEERALLRENLEQNENNKIVLLSGMIIETLEPEFYCEKYEVKSSDGTVLRVENGKYSDKLNIKDNETVEDPSKHLGERQTLLVSKPASTNQWVCEIETQCSGVAQANPNKRKLKQKQEDIKTFVIKIYEEFDRPINTVVEVIGFLSITPESASGEPSMETDDFGEVIPPAASPFSIHAITFKELPHNNPLLLDVLLKNEEYSREEVRGNLLKLLTHFMFGDEVAAHYVLLHLISNVYARVSGEVLGKFSINLTCSSIPKELFSEHIKKFYNLIELLMPDSFYFPLTIENLNTATFVPKKDFKTNRLQTGLLQLPKHAHLVLDETKLDNGKLDQRGCLAIADLSELIQVQQIHYDFQFYKIPFQTNIPVMILSEGKSLLPSDFLVPIKPDAETIPLINENIAAGVHFMKPTLNLVRKYLTECRLSDFEIGAEETKMIETDFVKMREETNLQVEHLHSLLVVSRLIGVSKGQKTLDTSSWETAKRLEIERNNRVEKRTSNEA